MATWHLLVDVVGWGLDGRGEQQSEKPQQAFLVLRGAIEAQRSDASAIRWIADVFGFGHGVSPMATPMSCL